MNARVWLHDRLKEAARLVCGCCAACPLPVTVANATRNSTTGTPGTFGSRMTFGCYSGHKFADMMNVKTIECTAAGWNETLTACDGESFAHSSPPASNGDTRDFRSGYVVVRVMG